MVIKKRETRNTYELHQCGHQHFTIYRASVKICKYKNVDQYNTSPITLSIQMIRRKVKQTSLSKVKIMLKWEQFFFYIYCALIRGKIP